MSEKRFTSNKRWIAEGTIVDICDNGKVIMQVFDDDNIQNVVDFLNEQQIEITELREAIDYLKTVIRYTIPNQMVADVFKYIGEDYE